MRNSDDGPHLLEVSQINNPSPLTLLLLSNALQCAEDWLWVVCCFIEATLEHSQAPGAYVTVRASMCCDMCVAPASLPTISEEVSGPHAIAHG